ncbi:hypothetical protein VSR01_05010 [Actinacidiphila sp. DG2A-62]|uniref:hypothetical protein n=1 Tax=Actinacidiphila sp. DG2A-62 TaxID=3108821 RepID=UPI002DB6ADE7|nr:hypothetical protein [Actinacidiphila sp. DG2A-62]MEC3992939.1 hypothetical protein [Actinacidiphila sp. DG2A-62]
MNLVLPVERYLFSTADLEELQAAQGILVARCMKGFGLTYKAPPPGPGLGPRSRMDRRYGLTDAKMAASSGYHLADRDPRGVKPATPNPPDGEARAALTGESGTLGKSSPLVNGKTVAPGGCSGVAEKAIFGKDGSEIDDFPQDLNARSFFVTKSDPEVQRVFKAWSDCMSGNGFSYPDPLAAIDDKRFRGATPSPAEIKVATADVACKARTNLVGVWFSAETEFEKGVIRQSASRLNGVLDGERKALDVASEVVRGAEG